MKKILLGLLALLFFVVVTPFADAARTAAAKVALPSPVAAPVVPMDKIVAVVNDQVITQSELDKELTSIKRELAQSHTPAPDAVTLRSQVLDHIINKDLQLQIARRAQIRISNEDLNKALLDIATRNHLTLAQLKASVEKEGVDYADFRQATEEEMVVNQVQQAAVGRNLTVSDQEVSDFMHSAFGPGRTDNHVQYHLQDILIPLPENPTTAQVQAAEQRAERIVEKLRQGANFQQLAAATSAGQQAFSGGDLGWRHAAELPGLFLDAVKALQPGAIAGPLRAPNGFHILKLVATRGDSQTLTRVQVQQLIFQRKLEEGLGTWLQELRAQAYIKLMD